MHLFYTPDIEGDLYQLNEEESRHCSKVLRLVEGDKVELIDGRGGLYKAEIISNQAKRTSLKIFERQQDFNKRNHYLQIAVAPTKNIDRFEWFLEKATEIGIDRVTPIICERSERKELKVDRLNKIITSAVKQSLKAYHPILDEPVSFKNFINNVEGEKYIAHCIDTPKNTLRDKITKNSRYTIMIGPEGDFSPAEIDSALNLGFIPVSLGSSRLRTETAALEACFELNFLNR